MPNTITAAHRLDQTRADLEAGKTIIVDMIARLDTLRAAASLRMKTGQAADDAATEEAKSLSAQISAASENLSILEAAVHAAEAGTDQYEAIIEAARQEIRNALKARAKAENASAVRAKAIEAASGVVTERQKALEDIAQIKRAAATEDASILSAEAEGKAAPARKIDQRELRRAEFDAVEDLEAARAALAQIEGEPIGDSIRLADARIRENVAAVMSAKASAHVDRAAYYRRMALREEIVAYGLVGARLAPPSVLNPLLAITLSVVHQMTGPGGRTLANDAAIAFQNFGATLAADPDADIDIGRAFASGVIWLEPQDRL